MEPYPKRSCIMRRRLELLRILILLPNLVTYLILYVLIQNLTVFCTSRIEEGFFGHTVVVYLLIWLGSYFDFFESGDRNYVVNLFSNCWCKMFRFCGLPFYVLVLLCC